MKTKHLTQIFGKVRKDVELYLPLFLVLAVDHFFLMRMFFPSPPSPPPSALPQISAPSRPFSLPLPPFFFSQLLPIALLNCSGFGC